jgi:lipid-A-disaccharide synthase
MEAAGVQLVARSSEMAVMGAVEVLPRLGFILQVRRGLKKSLKESGPALLILIDYPGFNLPQARFAHENGIRVFYYTDRRCGVEREDIRSSTHVTAWAHPPLMRRSSEVKFDARFVGNPSLDTVRRTLDRGEGLRKSLAGRVTTVA